MELLRSENGRDCEISCFGCADQWTIPKTKSMGKCGDEATRWTAFSRNCLSVVGYEAKGLFMNIVHVDAPQPWHGFLSSWYEHQRDSSNDVNRGTTKIPYMHVSCMHEIDGHPMHTKHDPCHPRPFAYSVWVPGSWPQVVSACGVAGVRDINRLLIAIDHYSLDSLVILLCSLVDITAFLRRCTHIDPLVFHGRSILKHNIPR